MAEAVICGILYRRFARPHRPGAIIGLYLILYPTARFFVEFARSYDELNPHLGPLVAEQWIALALIALGLYLLRSAGRTPARSIIRAAGTVGTRSRKKDGDKRT